MRVVEGGHGARLFDEHLLHLLLPVECLDRHGNLTGMHVCVCEKCIRGVVVNMYVCAMYYYDCTVMCNELLHVPYSRDQTPRLLMFSAQAEGRLLFKSGHCSRAAFVKLSIT